LDPRDRGRIWHDLYSFSRDFGQKGTYIEAISGLDIALWDLVGQYEREPVYRLLGGRFRESIVAYATGCYYRGERVFDAEATLPALASEAQSYIDAGFQAVKMKVGLLSVADDLRRVEAVRAAIGPRTPLLVDANHAYNSFSAMRMAKGLADLGVGWFEEPVVPEDRDGYRRLRQACLLPIAGGEAEFTRYGFRDLIAGGCVDIVQPDICASGGFSEWIKICALADAFGLAVIPHVWGSGIALAAALHALCALPPSPHTANPLPFQNEPVIEFDRNPNPLRDLLLTEPIVLKEGRVQVPEGFGLGVHVNEQELNRYC
jgi:D-galactarolactone cycloisomerase